MNNSINYDELALQIAQALPDSVVNKNPAKRREIQEALPPILEKLLPQKPLTLTKRQQLIVDQVLEIARQTQLNRPGLCDFAPIFRKAVDLSFSEDESWSMSSLMRDKGQE